MAEQSLENWIASELAAFEVPGAAVALISPTQETTLCFGVKRIGEPAKVDEHTPFSLASCSKAFTAYGIGLLVDRGKLAFDDPIFKHLPELTLDTQEVTLRATLRDLLGMRLGLQPVGACHWGRSRNFPHAEMFRRMQYLPRVAPFREGFVYSNPSYSALAETIARTSGMRFADFMAKEVFAPLGLKNTFIEEGPVSRTDVAIPHVKTDKGLVALSQPRCGGREGESCEYISAADFLPWLRFQLSSAGSQKLLSEKTFAELHTIQMPTPSPKGGSGYCMGWMRGVQPDGRTIFAHEGGEFGASTFAIVCPEEKVAIAVLLSRRTGAGVRAIAYSLLDRLVGVTGQDRKKEFLDLEAKEQEGTAAYMASSFPVNAEQAVPDLATFVGEYVSPISGKLTLTRDGEFLRAVFDDVDVYNCRLRPLDASIFRLMEFDEVGLQQELRSEARLRIAPGKDSILALEAPGLGTFTRVA